MLRISKAAMAGARQRGRALAFALLFSLMPLPAFAGEGSVKVHLTKGDNGFLIAALLLGLLAVITGLFLRSSVLASDPGPSKMQEVATAIKEGALAYLRKQVGTMSIFVVLLAVALLVLFGTANGWLTGGLIALCFILGVVASYSAGYTGMLMAVDGNVRTASAAQTSNKTPLEIAFKSGAVTGLMTVGLGLTGASLIFLLYPSEAMKLLVGFGFGGSLAALFMRVGGGIFTKAADVGADLVGKVEAGIPEDDARNPATIADNVGDNVGDCAGMAADVFESFSVTLVAAIVLAAATAEVFDERVWMRLVLVVFLICGIGVAASITGILLVQGSDDPKADPLKLLRRGFVIATSVAAIGVAILCFFMLGGSSKNSQITTSTLTSMETLQREEFKKITDFRDSLAKTLGKHPYEVTAADVQKDPNVKKGTGIEDEDELKAVSQQAIAYREDQALPAPDLTDYRRLDFTSDDPALNYTVQNQNDPSGGYKTLRELYGIAAEGKPVTDKDKPVGQEDLVVYDVAISFLRGQQGQAPPPAQHGFVGPLPKKMLDDQIAKMSASGEATVTVNHSYPVYFYKNPEDGNLALVADGDFPTGNLQRPPLLYFKVSKDEVEKAKVSSSGSSGVPAMPEEFQANFGEIHHAPVAWYWFVLPVLFGIALAFGIEQLTDYYVSTHRKPTKEVAKLAEAGAAPMIIQGFSYALESSAFMVVGIVVALLVPLWIFPPGHFNGSFVPSFFGVALVGLGLLSTTGYLLAMDTFGPISDNAQGIYEMSGAAEENKFGAEVVARLDAAGNTTKALTKGFAISTAVIAATALFHSFVQDAHLAHIGLRLDYPEIFLGLLIGGAAPYLFSAFAINAVGRAAFQLINEVRKQFRADPGIMKGTSKPNYAACVAIVTAAAQRELVAPGILAITLPVAVGFGFSIGKPATQIGGHWYTLAGAEALGGFLAGAILSGQLMAVLLANSGGIWDNAKKLVEDGLHGGKGTEAHKASVTGDTVGDPFKDTAGPALNPLIKVMNLVALLLAPVIIQPLKDIYLIVISAICVIALVISLAFAKRGSFAQDLSSSE